MSRNITGGMGFVLKGDGWVGKDGSEKRSREKRSKEMDRKMKDKNAHLQVKKGDWKKYQ
jgi:hypothetical protein